MTKQVFYIARNKDNGIWLFFAEPQKNHYTGRWVVTLAESDGMVIEVAEDELQDGINPKWTDDKPIAVNIKYFLSK